MNQSNASVKKTKDQLRTQLRAQRRALSCADQHRAALSLCFKSARSFWFKQAKHIGFYWPNDGELSPLPLMHLAQSLGKQCYLPRLIDKSLEFVVQKRGRALKPNRFGIPEPTSSLVISTADLDVILMPLVGFDSSGNRLGMGGGFYDRTLSPLINLLPARPLLLGVAHACQRIDTLPVDPWDIGLDGVVTDRSGRPI